MQKNRGMLVIHKFLSRVGGQMRYVTSDNRDFLLALLRGLGKDVTICHNAVNE